MKLIWYFTFPCLLLALIALMLPFTVIDYGSVEFDIVYYTYENSFIYINEAIILVIAILSLVKRTVNIALLGLMFSIANMFFIFLIFVSISVFRGANFNGVFEFRSGAYLLLSLAPFLVYIAAMDVYQAYKKR